MQMRYWVLGIGMSIGLQTAYGDFANGGGAEANNMSLMQWMQTQTEQGQAIFQDVSVAAFPPSGSGFLSSQDNSDRPVYSLFKFKSISLSDSDSGDS